MKHTVQLILDREYFSEMFSQSMRYANKWRKIERIIGPVFFIMGIILLVKTSGKTSAPMFLVLIGIYEIFSPLIKRPFWLGRLMKSKIANNNATFNFTEEGIETITKNTQSRMKWEGIERFLETPKGVLIWPQKGIHMYVPKSVVSDETILFIKEKLV